MDVRDLAEFLLDALADGAAGPVDVISRSGHASTRTLLEACTTTTAPPRRPDRPVHGSPSVLEARLLSG